jgi:Bacterial PH domain
VTQRSTIRLPPPVILWWVWVAFVVLNVADYSVQGLPSARFSAVLASILLLVTGLVYTLALRPKVIEDGDGLTVVNPFRIHRLPWPVITSVDTGEWVRVHFTRPTPTSSTPSPPTPSPPTPSSGAEVSGGTRGSGESTGLVNCWALYVSTRARRKVAVGSAPRADGMSRRLGRLVTQPSGYGQPASRLPDEARYLASLPVSAAIAARLDTRARRERTHATATASVAAKASVGNGASPATKPSPAASAADGVSAADGASVADGVSVATTTWSWLSLAAVAIPAALLLVVALV